MKQPATEEEGRLTNRHENVREGKNHTPCLGAPSNETTNTGEAGWGMGAPECPWDSRCRRPNVGWGVHPG